MPRMRSFRRPCIYSFSHFSHAGLASTPQNAKRVLCGKWYARECTDSERTSASDWSTIWRISLPAQSPQVHRISTYIQRGLKATDAGNDDGRNPPITIAAPLKTPLIASRGSRLNKMHASILNWLFRCWKLTQERLPALDLTRLRPGVPSKNPWRANIPGSNVPFRHTPRNRFGRCGHARGLSRLTRNNDYFDERY